MMGLLLGMWRTLRGILGLSEEYESDSEDGVSEEEEPSPPDDTDSSLLPASDDQREFIGTVTSLHSAYGLINHEICFTMEAVSGSMPKIGDMVHVVSKRKNAVGGWRAIRVSIASSDDFFSESAATVPCQLPCTQACASDAALFASEESCRELLENKDGLSITENIDFGNMQIGESSSLTIVIRYCLFRWLLCCSIRTFILCIRLIFFLQ